MISIEKTADGVRFAVKVQPRASTSELAGSFGDAVKVRLQAPPVDGAANEALIAFLADSLGVGRRDVRIVHGEHSRLKAIEVHGMTVEAVRARLTSG